MNVFVLGWIVLVVGFGRIVGGNAKKVLEPCSKPAIEGTAYTFEKTVHNLTDKFKWTLDNGDVTVVECDVGRKPPCRSRIDPALYSGSIEEVLAGTGTGGGDYEAVLTIHHVTRTRDATSWKWFDGDEMVGECRLDVRYKPIVAIFKANTKLRRLEVMEGDTVTFWCDAEGNPRPTITVKGQRSSKYVTLQDTAMESHTTRAGGEKTMGCNDTDSFYCVAENSVGVGVGKKIATFVKCAPKFLPWWKESTRDFSLKNGSDLVIKIPITSYPEPTSYALATTGNGNSVTRTEVTRDKYHVFYESDVPPAGMAVLRMFRVDSADIGQFALTMENGIGNRLEFSFNVSITQEIPTAVTKDDDDGEMDNEKFTTALVVGISVAFGLVMCCLCFMFGIVGMQVWDKQQKKKADEYARNKNRIKLYEEYHSPPPSSRCLHLSPHQQPSPLPPSSSPPPLPPPSPRPFRCQEITQHNDKTNEDESWYKTPRHHSSSNSNDETMMPSSNNNNNNHNNNNSHNNNKPSAVVYDLIYPSRMHHFLDNDNDNDAASAKSTTVYWHDSTHQNSAESLSTTTTTTATMTKRPEDEEEEEEEDSNTECSSTINGSSVLLDSFANHSYNTLLQRSPEAASTRYHFPKPEAIAVAATIDRFPNHSPMGYLANEDSLELEFLYNKSKPESTVSESIDEDGYEIPASSSSNSKRNSANRASSSNKMHGRYVDLSQNNHYTQLEIDDNNSNSE